MQRLRSSRYNRFDESSPKKENIASKVMSFYRPFWNSGIMGKVVVTGQAIVASGVVAGTAANVAPHIERHTYTGTVTNTVVKNDQQASKYLVFVTLKDGRSRVFENTDSFIERKFDSSDVQAQILPGKTYEFNTYGWRIPLVSMYENIVTVTRKD